MSRRQRRKPRLGVVIYTYDRVDDARVNIELFRSRWEQSALFRDIFLVHSYNGRRSWYPQKHGENVLIRRRNPGHFEGAADLMDAGVHRILQERHVDYILVLAADTWLTKPRVIATLVAKMSQRQQRIATCPWGILRPHPVNTFQKAGMATDFFILDARWARRYRMFPLGYREFKRRYGSLIRYSGSVDVSVERLAWMRFIEAVEREVRTSGHTNQYVQERVLEITEREPVHRRIDSHGSWIRYPAWPKLGLVTHHDLRQKTGYLRGLPRADGPTIQKLRARKGGRSTRAARQEN